MATIHRDEDADLSVLDGQTVAVVGYGNQGRSQALNLRDSGVEVVVGNRRDGALEQAERDGFGVLPIAAAVARADAVFLLIPDEVMPEVYTAAVAPNLRGGACLVCASGYNVAFGLLRPAADVDVVLVAPRMIGVGVRESYESGAGFPSFVGVHQDATGNAKARMLALCKALGSTRAGCIEMSMHDEATLDLFTEQGFGPAFGRVMMSAVELLVGAGYPPEAVLLELYLSGEFAYSLEKIREVGMARQHEYHSQTSQYGTVTRGARYLGLDPALKETMGKILDEIRSGAFAEEWSKNQAQAAEIFEKVRAARDQLPMMRWEQQTRAAFGIGDAARNR
ncbi:MAG: ketol-acid reductoisomerase [Myxococcota bacterium]|nr:ketol-acid reductoisomerase [Myxococcota bacterium]